MHETTRYQSDLLGEHYLCYRHPSGLPIYVFPKKLSTAYALFAADYGASDNILSAEGKPTLPSGVAHFLEHKLFANADGSDSFERFSALGADANAYTSHTRTVYLFSCTDRFDEAFSELLTFVTHPYFTEENVARERGIIAEEIRMCRDNPYERCYYNMLRGMYHTHPVASDVCGTLASVARITPETLYTAYRTFYDLSNMVLAVCGDVAPETVFDLADQLLPKTAKNAPVPRLSNKITPRVYRPRTAAKGVVARPIFSIGIKDTAVPSESAARVRRDACFSVLQEILFGPSGELYQSLTDRGMIAPGLATDYVISRDAAFQQIAGEADDPEAVLGEILAYIEKMRKTGIPQADFERCRRVEYAEYIKSFDSCEEIANTLLSFVMEGATLFEQAEVIRTMRREEVENLLCTCYRPEQITLSVVDPIGKGEK